MYNYMIMDMIMLKDKKIMEKFKFVNWIEVFIFRDLFIILKDYKLDFIYNLICIRFINLSKFEIVIISNNIFDSIKKLFK